MRVSRTRSFVGVDDQDSITDVLNQCLEPALSRPHRIAFLTELISQAVECLPQLGNLVTPSCGDALPQVAGSQPGGGLLQGIERAKH